jgi:UDP-3-O-[3-hydroxymyristoyl] glucosamine N-acyltransferase
VVAFTVCELVDFLSSEGLLAQEAEEVEDGRLVGFSPAAASRAETVTWLREVEHGWPPLRAAVAIVPAGAENPPEGLLVLRANNPRVAFARAGARFASAPRPSGIEPTAVVGEGCRIATTAYVGHHCVVGAGVDIGEGTVIGHGVSILEGCRIGANCTIHPGVVIGADGFGYERDEDGAWVKFPHLGHVVIGDDVDVGANTCIDRGALGDTRVERGAKVDNLCHIAHNVVLGEDSVVIALSMIGGSTTLEPGAYVAPGAVVRNKVVIGARALVGLGAVVVGDVVADDVVMGVPARSRR